MLLCWAYSEGFNELMDLRTTFARARACYSGPVQCPSPVPQSRPVLGRARAKAVRKSMSSLNPSEVPSIKASYKLKVNPYGRTKEFIPCQLFLNPNSQINFNYCTQLRRSPPVHVRICDQCVLYISLQKIASIFMCTMWEKFQMETLKNMFKVTMKNWNHFPTISLLTNSYTGQLQLAEFVSTIQFL